MNGIKKAVLVSEVGWRGTRNFSLFLHRKLIPCEALIKGKVAKEVLDIITPYDNIRILSLSRALFIPVLVAKIISSGVGAGSSMFIFTKESTRRRFSLLLRMARSRSLLLNEAGAGYDIYDERSGKLNSIEDVVKK